MECNFCQQPMSPGPNIYNMKYKWAKCLICHHCNYSAYMCGTCSRANIMFTKKTMQQHNKYHTTKRFKASLKHDNNQVK